jgi:ABC-2 type transport system ATP-binding protein
MTRSKAWLRARQSAAEVETNEPSGVTDMIRTSGVVRRFGAPVALDGPDLLIPNGTVLGSLGSNGAGKTTAARILTSQIEAGEGSVEVVGPDARAEPHRVRERIGPRGQSPAIAEYPTERENLEMVGGMHHLGRAGARGRARARELPLSIGRLNQSAAP